MENNINFFDVLRVSEAVERFVCVKDDAIIKRKYWRFRGGRWYGGIATADCVGCNLRCKFCGPLLSWMRKPDAGKLLRPIQVVKRLVNIASKRKYRYVRISGGEPTLCIEHLYEILGHMMHYPYLFILETNGILIGHDERIAERLSEFSNIHVRLSIKGANREEFEQLTGASGKFFDYQLQAIRNLLDYQVSFHPAIVASFSSKENIKSFINHLQDISPVLPQILEIEYIILYPHVLESLIRNHIVPKKAYTVKGKIIDEETFRILFLKKKK